MSVGEVVLVLGSLLLTIQSAYSGWLMLYAWEDEEKHLRNRAPRDFEPPRCSFTVLLPARHEEAAIRDTIERVVGLKYPPELVQVLVIIEAGDSGTIEEVNGNLGELASRGVCHVRPVDPDRQTTWAEYRTRTRRR